MPQRFFTFLFVQEEEQEHTESSYISGRVEGGGGTGLSVLPNPPRENMIHVVGVKNDRPGLPAHNKQVTVMKVGVRDGGLTMLYDSVKSGRESLSVYEPCWPGSRTVQCCTTVHFFSSICNESIVYTNDNLYIICGIIFSPAD
jgi:hypothetical protein